MPMKWYDARPIRKLENPNPMGASYQAETIFESATGYSWTESNLKDWSTAVEQASALLRPDRQRDLVAKLSKEPISMAVAVSESSMPQGAMPPGHPQTNQSSKPRMLVFGDSTWVSNREMLDERWNDYNFTLFSSSLAWLRERPDVGQVAENKERDFWKPNPAEDLWRLYLLPGSLMVCTILGLGMGIWVVRRR